MQEASLNAVKETYNHLAKIYNFIYGKTLQNGRDTLGKSLTFESNKKILEIGVGTGLTLNLYPINSEITGVDVSNEMLIRAKQRIQTLGLKNIKLITSDGEHTGLPNDYFDHVVLAYVYSVTPKPEAIIQEAFRVCKPNGHIWILNHFSGMGGWNFLEALIKPCSRFLGFRSIFPFGEFVTSKNWNIVSIKRVNAFGLSRLIKIKK
ncbi:MAG: phosphatidylethanolamine/phosphatidyl-N-methylethanolamine N-methyltransferase [Methylophilaceae bacterium]